MGEEKVDTDVLEALDFPVQCSVLTRVTRYGTPEPVSERCPEAAKWIMQCRSCSVIAMACSAHGVLTMTHRNVSCAYCAVSGPGLVVFSITPMVVS